MNYPNGAPVAQLSTVTMNPAQAQASDGSVTTLASGHQAELLASEIHGKRYVAAARSNVFVASTPVAGISPLAPGGTTAGVMFWNPVGSGVLMEVHKITCIPLTATDVVGVIGLEFGTPPTAVGTALTINAMPLQGSRGGPLCKAASGSTIVAMSYLMSLNFVQTTAGLAINGGTYDFDGELVLYPGAAVNIVSTTTQATNKWLQDITWSEWLP